MKSKTLSIVKIAVIMLLLVVWYKISNAQDINNAIQKGAQWLVYMQMPDGGWGVQDYESASFFYVAPRCFVALLDAGYTLYDPVIQNALAYILANKNADGSLGSWWQMIETTWAMMVLKITNNDIKQSRNWVLSQQQPDGSFSTGNSYAKINSTAYAIIALLISCSKLNDPEIQQAKEFILDNQNPDGSFCERPPWNAAQETAFIMMTLSLTGLSLNNPQMALALNYVQNNQHADGGWGPIVPSHCSATGFVIFSMITCGIDRNDPRIVSAVNYLLSKQNADGSWPDSWASNCSQQQTNGAMIGLAVTSGQLSPFGKVSNVLFYKEKNFQLAFVSDRVNRESQIWIAKSNGSELKKLTNFNAPIIHNVIFSPEGEQIIFRKDGEEVWKIDVTGTGLTQLTTGDGISESPQDWTRNGNKILIQSERSNNNGWFEVWIMNADGRDFKNLTQGEGTGGIRRFSPDGSKILYDQRSYWNHPSHLKIMNQDGSNKHEIHVCQTYTIDGLWFPNNKIIFTDGSSQSSLNIYSIDPDGSNLIQLTNLNGNERFHRLSNLVLSPDWSNIVFYANNNGNNDIFVINFDGTGLQQLTTDPGNDKDALFSPDGSKIFWISDRSGSKSIWFMNTDGSNKQQVTDDAGEEIEFTVTFSFPLNEPPIAICKNIIKPTTSNCGANVMAAEVNNGSYDPNNDPITLHLDPPAPYPVGTTMVNLTVTDIYDASDQCTATITVVDNTPPVINCPENEILETDASCQVIYEGPVATATDNCNVTVTSDPPLPAALEGVGEHTITYTAMDASGNTASCVQTIKLIDVIPPNITCPDDIIYGTDPGVCEAVVEFTVSATDNCGILTLMSTPESGNSFPLGETTVTCIAKDESGNEASCTFTVTVEDNENPKITVFSEPITLWPPNHNYQTIEVNHIVTAVSDNCSELSVSDVDITKVSSDELEIMRGGGGGGNTEADIVIANDCKSVDLRRERRGRGNGRVYTVHLVVKDESDNIGTAKYLITVPVEIDGLPAVDDGPEAGYTVTSSCGDYLLKLVGNYGNVAEQDKPMPEGFALFMNYPNPFNPETIIEYAIPEPNHVTLEIYNIAGEKIVTLGNSSENAGYHSVIWYGRDYSGRPVAGGIYLCRIHAGHFQDTIRMVYLK